VTTEKRLDKVDKELEHKKNAINMYKLELDKVNTKIKEFRKESVTDYKFKIVPILIQSWIETILLKI